MSITDILQQNGALDSTGDRIYGVMNAIVTNNTDPDKLGRVKLKYPWRSSEDESEWARIAFPMGGKERGMYFIPEVEDEVLVLFENGDIHHPYVIGALWNGQDKPPDDNAKEKNNIRKIKSRSGHELIFDDNSEEKKENVILHSKGEHKILLDDSSGQEKVEITTKAGHKILLNDASGQEKVDITSKSGHKITLNDAPGQEKIEIKDKTGSNKIVFDSMQNSIEIESTMKLSIKSQMIEIEANAMMTLKSSGILKLQGSMININ